MSVTEAQIEEAVAAGFPVVNVDPLAMRIGSAIITRADVDTVNPGQNVLMVYETGKRQFGTVTAVGFEARVASIHPSGEEF